MPSMMLARSNSDVGSYRAKEPPDSLQYRERVAIPIMNAVDDMPAQYRALVHEFGYVDVYRAWQQDWTPAQIKAHARDGFFKL